MDDLIQKVMEEINSQSVMAAEQAKADSPVSSQFLLPRRKRSNWSEEDMREALEELERGENIDQIVAKYGMSRSALSARFEKKKNGQVFGFKKWTEEDMTMALNEVLKEGAKLTKVARKYNIPQVTLYERRQRLLVGDKKPKMKYSEVDMQSALKDLSEGKRLMETSRKYNIPSATLRSRRDALRFGLSTKSGTRIYGQAVKKPLSSPDEKRGDVALIPCSNYTSVDLANAVQDIIVNGLGILQASRKYRIPATTLRNQKEIKPLLPDKRKRKSQTDVELNSEKADLFNEKKIDENAVNMLDQQMHESMVVKSTDHMAVSTDSQSTLAGEVVSQPVQHSNASISENLESMLTGEVVSPSTQISNNNISASVPNTPKKSRRKPSKLDAPWSERSARYKIKKCTNWTEEDMQNAIKELKEGERILNVAKKYGISPSNLWVRNKLGKTGREVGRKVWTEEDVNKALEDLSQGGKLNRISFKYNIPLTTLYERRKRSLLSKQADPSQEAASANATESKKETDTTFDPTKLHKRTPKKIRKWSSEDMKNAIEELIEGKDLADVAEKYNIPKLTLSLRNRGVKSLRAKNAKRMKCNKKSDSVLTVNLQSMLGKKNNARKKRIFRCKSSEGQSTTNSQMPDIGMEIPSGKPLKEEFQSEQDESVSSAFPTPLNQTEPAFHSENPVHDLDSDDFSEEDSSSLEKESAQSNSTAFTDPFSSLTSFSDVASTNTTDRLFFLSICLEMEKLPSEGRHEFKCEILKILHQKIKKYQS